MKRIFVVGAALLFLSLTYQKEGTLKLALLKYNGGGDWYANPTSLPNLAKFCNEEMNTNFDRDYEVVDVGSAELFNYPFIHMTGHGNVIFFRSGSAKPAILPNCRWIPPH